MLSLLCCSLLAAACSSGDGDDVAEAVATAPTVTVATTLPAPTASTTTTTSTLPTTTTTEGPTEWTLLVGGDVLMDRSEPAGVDVFAGIEPALSTADLSIINVEMAISDRGAPVPGKEFVFRAPPSAADRIGAAGVDVASLGNNHARDFGPEAMADTRVLLEDNGVAVVGAGSSRSAAFAPASFDVDGVSVAVIGISYIVPGGFGATSERSGVASGRDDSGADVATIAEAAASHDVVIAYVHWGIERRTCESDVQRSQAQALLDAGATAVIGAHPHVLQPIERLDSGQLVVWSLGNFIWHPRSGITGDTAVVEVGFVDDEIAEVTVHPHQLDENGAPVAISEGSRHDRILDITSGDCDRHDPGPLPTTTTMPDTTVADTTPETTTAPDTTESPDTTAAPETTTPETTAVPETTAAPATTAPPTTVVDGEAEGTDGPSEPELSGAVPPGESDAGEETP